MDGSMTGMLKVIGLTLMLLGVLGFAIPIFTTQQTRDVATLGDLKLQTTENRSFVISPLVAGGALTLGGLLLAISLYQRR
jgi:hypothetical protein